MYDFERVYKVTDLNHRLVSSLKMVDESLNFRATPIKCANRDTNFSGSKISGETVFCLQWASAAVVIFTVLHKIVFNFLNFCWTDGSLMWSALRSLCNLGIR